MDALIFPTYDSSQNTNITMNDLLGDQYLVKGDDFCGTH